MTEREVSKTTHRRGRRHDTATPRKGDIRESTILESFEELLKAQPYAELSMDDLARAAGMSRPSLYFYFSSKEEVLLTLLERRHLQVMQLTLKLEESVPPAERIASALAGYLATWRTHAAVFVTFFEVAMTSPAFGERWRANLGESIPAITALIDATKRTAPTSPTADELAWALIWSAQHNIYETFRRPHSLADENRLHLTLCHLWLRAITD